MSQYYKVISQDPSPLSLVDAKTYLKITSAADDPVIQDMIDSCTSWGEIYTGRDFRAKSYMLLIDCFESPVCIIKDPVLSIDQVQHLVGGSLIAIDSSVYYLKKLQAGAEILLTEGKVWPTDTDQREQAVDITFSTEPYYRQDEIIECLKRHVAFMYFNRGDCAGCGDAAKGANVTFKYDSFRIPRIC